MKITRLLSVLLATSISFSAMAGGFQTTDLVQDVAPVDAPALSTRLQALGLTPAQAQERIARLSPAEQQQLNADLERAPAAGMSGRTTAAWVVALGVGAYFYFTYR
ncbi:MAG: hypothetical protein EBU72_11215 [Betaproteobacteria bacterium]|jgi:hypothetical protein|nr:hypothetical protein [Betaproteobacteria bacterium]